MQPLIGLGPEQLGPYSLWARYRPGGIYWVFLLSISLKCRSLLEENCLSSVKWTLQAEYDLPSLTLQAGYDLPSLTLRPVWLWYKASELIVRHHRKLGASSQLVCFPSAQRFSLFSGPVRHQWRTIRGHLESAHHWRVSTLSNFHWFPIGGAIVMMTML